MLTDDLSCRRRLYRNHPEVTFKPGPFYMGDGILGWAANINCILWTLFVVIIFAMPNYLPVTSVNMNYASVRDIYCGPRFSNYAHDSIHIGAGYHGRRGHRVHVSVISKRCPNSLC